MKKINIILLFLLLLNLSGCWNYREVDKFSIVAGISIDKGINEKIELSVEIIEISSGRETKLESKIITAEGNSLFDAIRNVISIAGKRLYWSHAKIMILSKSIASEGVFEILEWFSRDAETRLDVEILISTEESAKEIFMSDKPLGNILSYTLLDTFENQVNLSKTPTTDILLFDIESNIKGNSIVLPVISLKRENKKNIPQINGCAIIKEDKLAGFLNGEETKDLLFIKNQIKGGILVEEMKTENKPVPVSLEIFKNKTKVTPEIKNKEIIFNINIETTVAVDEVNGKGNFFDEKGIKKLEQNASNNLKKRTEALIKKLQQDYGADIFGFSSKLREDKVQTYKNVSNNWSETFKNLKVNIKAKVIIKNSGLLSKNIIKGE